MTKISEALTYGLTIRESANDGSDFTNPAADYRRLFLGEDGQLHVKDTAGTVTAIGAGDITTDAAWAAKGDLIVGTANNTAAILTAGSNGKILTAASGEATGLKWETAASGGYTFPTIVQVKEANEGNSIGATFVLGAAPASGNSLLMGISEVAGTGPSAVSSTNTTWTKVLGITQNVSLWVGVVAGGAGGTTITLTGVSSYSYATVMEVAETLTPTLAHGSFSDVGSSFAPSYKSVSSITPGNLIVCMVSARSTDGKIHALDVSNPPSVGVHRARIPMLVGYATGTTAICQAEEVQSYHVLGIAELT